MNNRTVNSFKEPVKWIREHRRDLQLSAVFWFSVTGILAVYTTIADAGYLWRLLFVVMMINSLAMYTVLWLLGRLE